MKRKIIMKNKLIKNTQRRMGILRPGMRFINSWPKFLHVFRDLHANFSFMYCLALFSRLKGKFWHDFHAKSH
jgi:hypothetical protein